MDAESKMEPMTHFCMGVGEGWREGGLEGGKGNRFQKCKRGDHQDSSYLPAPSQKKLLLKAYLCRFMSRKTPKIILYNPIEPPEGKALGLCPDM